ncbi:epithelial membrane protein 1-like [Thamnophis elegans]|uniref:epithelial membrane protein 1-like n=1 Tax=Thamnophis elegans TaxID=35005 RepID=UPI0013766562|nr:epithelial membrane protein 1-like [Thamnophis elegans]
MSALHVVAVLSSCFSLLCLYQALNTDYWRAAPGIHLGLWKVCKHHECFPTFMVLELGPIRAVQAFMFLGLISGVVSLGGLCVLFWKPLLCKISMSRTACLASFSAALCVMIAMSIFASYNDPDNGWSFGLAVLSFLFYLLTGGLACTLHRRKLPSGLHDYQKKY